MVLCVRQGEHAKALVRFLGDNGFLMQRKADSDSSIRFVNSANVLVIMTFMNRYAAYGLGLDNMGCQHGSSCPSFVMAMFNGDSFKICRSESGNGNYVLFFALY